MTNEPFEASTIASPKSEATATALTIITRLRVEPDQIEAFRAVVYEYAKDVRVFEGSLCTDYRVLATPGDPLRVVIIARYASEAAYHAHLNAPHTVSVMRIMQPLLAEEPTLEVYLG